ncbi:xylulose kinase [Enterococcus faecium]|uniref:FGGY-family carbohydrate kinase n=1 Tax=Enterococcus faecium TaxID=1352 RepID=UPI000CF07DCD|nr:FGGY-family carbohydrate kinase [Enterococcus faecium]EMF0363130.1 xylulose kinase [Enterococcus faecium]EMF0364967.1 xylulose kinase [Enterococcus faecium]PQC92199.1 xylulose kinase [Enterococcus faecium]
MVGLKRKELAGRRFTRIVSVGGGAKNLAWLQIQADIFDATVYCLSVEEGPALGATMIAALGLGWFDTPESCCQNFIQYTDAVEPLLQNVEKYHKIYQQCRKTYPATKEICHDL